MSSRIEGYPTFRGVRLEDPKFDNPLTKAVIVVSDLAARVRRTEVTGSLPKEGPALVVVNHSTALDPFIVGWLAERSGRTIRIVARDTLIDPKIQEEQKVLERTGRADDVLNRKPNLNRKILGKALHKAGNPILVHRGKAGSEFFKEVQETFESGQMVGIFFQETRSKKQDDLSKARLGAASIANRNPEVPVYVVGLTDVALNRANFFHPRAIISKPLPLSHERRGNLVQVTEDIKVRMQSMFGRR